ncbi:hypothetical protein IL306_004058 [Fusarium sp. DS 682]|nr:hypothetical protein IL306_004058 [Fusarium sp. DS 682]
MHSRGILGSPARLNDTPIHSAISPRSTPFYHGDRSPNDSSDIDCSPQTRTKRNDSGDATSTNSYEFVGAEDIEMEDGQSLKRLHIDDAYAPGGQKRRAASPNDEHMLSMSSDMSRRRDLSSRGSPQDRYPSLARGATIPSVSNSRFNAYISNMSVLMHPAGLAATNSFGRLSSPGGISPTSCNSPSTIPASLNTSPQTSISGRGSIHSRAIADASASKITKVQKPNGTKVQGFFICKCCPKKPKRFETLEELKPGEADTCGYCGDEFPRSGRDPVTGALSGGNALRYATEQDWDERIRHLQEVHKFRECKSSKKFFRADHFRQHIKHSHAGTMGSWTNMLENACRLEEDPTPR